jgi:23S rRNA pseudouridine1911/1915/1917 synthase
MPTALSIEAPLALQGERGLVRIRMVPDADGLASRTDVEPVFVDQTTQRTLVRCHPRTGRQHQIRAHLAHAGFPIAGDKLYAMGDTWFDAFTRHALGAEERAQLDHPRQALHAERLSLTGIGASFSSPLPDDLRTLLPDLRPGLGIDLPAFERVLG